MAYTSYPAEAAKFQVKTGQVRTKLDNIKTSLHDIGGVLSNNEHNDFLSLKALDANEKLETTVDEAISAIDADTSEVNDFANKLEQEEQIRQAKLFSDKLKDNFTKEEGGDDSGGEK